MNVLYGFDEEPGITAGLKVADWLLVLDLCTISNEILENNKIYQYNLCYLKY